MRLDPRVLAWGGIFARLVYLFSDIFESLSFIPFNLPPYFAFVSPWSRLYAAFWKDVGYFPLSPPSYPRIIFWPSVLFYSRFSLLILLKTQSDPLCYFILFYFIN
ncbi:hypothetical protein V6Z11_D13G142700 [Gossypium hirsutum]